MTGDGMSATGGTAMRPQAWACAIGTCRTPGPQQAGVVPPGSDREGGSERLRCGMGGGSRRCGHGRGAAGRWGLGRPVSRDGGLLARPCYHFCTFAVRG